ncbi:unnamed protein product [Allacma fusca]|uniref:Uncharacterized protein n=1 Tax=Allacma fusca TaxID=39272 RepID=A0A8J2P316_9HEXA|nr:unnamed protein product [Allacma fusca]
MEVAYEAQNSVALDREYLQPIPNVGLEPSLVYRVSSGTDSLASQNSNVPQIQRSSFDQYGALHPIIKGRNVHNNDESDKNWRQRKETEQSTNHNQFGRSNSPYPRKRDFNFSREGGERQSRSRDTNPRQNDVRCFQ